jgi:hypothetical protein
MTAPPDTLDLPADAVLVVGGIPGAGKTTWLAGFDWPDAVTVLDSQDVRRRHFAWVPAWVPYRAVRPLVHAGHYLAILAAIRRPAPLVIHECATRGWLRRAMTRWAGRAGRPAHLLLLDADPETARAGQRARGRRLHGRAMRRHERVSRPLAAAAAVAPPDGFAGSLVLARGDAAAIQAVRFGPVSARRRRATRGGARPARAAA